MKNFYLFFIFFSFFFSYSQVQFARGMDFEDNSYPSVPLKAKLTRGLTVVPVAASIKIFAPTPADQGAHGTCTSWAAAFCGRTIMEAIKNNWTDKKQITANAYSAAALFRMLKPEDSLCKGGSAISDAFQIMKDIGAIKKNDLQIKCVPTIEQSDIELAGSSKIKDFMRLFEDEDNSVLVIQSVKKSIQEKKPVVIGMICPNSFFKARGVWNPTEEALESYGGHALCVVGYDDDQNGGAFEIQNSWGKDWGNEGYIWIKYSDFAKFVKY